MTFTDFGSNLVSNPNLTSSTSGWTVDDGSRASNAAGGRFYDTAGSAGRKIAHTIATIAPYSDAVYWSLSGVTFHSLASTTSRFGLRIEWRDAANAVVGTAWSQTYTLSATAATIPRVEFGVDGSGEPNVVPADATKAYIYVVSVDAAAFDHRAFGFTFKKAYAPWQVNAGSNSTIEQGESEILNASYSGGNGTISSTLWSALDGGPTPATPTADPSSVGPFPNPGTYTYRHTVTHAEGGTSYDDVAITVNPGAPPIADAGLDGTAFTGGTATLSGDGESGGADITSWFWEEVTTSGVDIDTPTSQNTDVGPFDLPGTYTFQLTVEDEDGLQGTDEVDVVVTDGPADTGSLADRVRLEVLDSGGSVSEISNHSGVTNTTGWTADQGTLTAQTVTGGHSGRALRIADADVGIVLSSPWTVIPGQTVGVGLSIFTDADLVSYGLYLQFLDSGSNHLSYASVVGSGYTSESYSLDQTPYAYGVAPPNAAYARIRLVTTSNADANVENTYFYNAYAYVGDYYDVVGIGFSTGGEVWQNLITDSLAISIDRGADVEGVTDKNKVGLLTARLKGAASTPEQNTRLRPGNTIRVVAFNRTSAEFEPIFTGTVTESSSDWATKKPLVTITATDVLSDLDNYVAPMIEGGTFTDRIDSIMEYANVLYDVDDTATSAPTGQPVSYDQSGTVLTQLELATNTEHGLFYVRKDGVVQLKALNSVGTGATALFSDTPYSASVIDYYSADVVFDSKSLVNSLNITQKAVAAAEDSEGSEGDTVLGPYTVASSVADWGIQKADLQVNDYTPEYHAEYYLGTWSTPKLTCRSLKFEVGDDLYKAINLEVLQAAHVTFSNANLQAYFRILSIHHEITPDRWDVEITFRPMEVVSDTVTVADPPGGAGTGPEDSVPEEYKLDTGWIDVTYASGWSAGTPGQMQVRRIGKTCFIRGGTQKSSGSITAGTYTTVSGTALPEHMRPGSVYRSNNPGTGIRLGSFVVTSDGDIQVAAGNGVTSMTWIGTGGSWAVG